MTGSTRGCAWPEARGRENIRNGEAGGGAEQRDRDRDRQRERQRQTHTQREREREVGGSQCEAMLLAMLTGH